ncbi:MAG: hypothetical protein IKI41_07730 [Clostridia bacterium]|nr:hypothetical protein [Clostridia bacterium]
MPKERSRYLNAGRKFWKGRFRSGETAILRKKSGFSGLWIFRRRNGNSPEKRWIFRAVDFPAEKREFSGKTVDSPSCGSSAEKRQFSGKRWILRAVDFLRRNGNSPEKRWILRAVDFPAEKRQFSGKRVDLPGCGFSGGETTILRKNGGFSGLWIFRRRNGNSPEKRWILRAAELQQKNNIFPEKEWILRTTEPQQKNNIFPKKRWIFQQKPTVSFNNQTFL